MPVGTPGRKALVKVTGVAVVFADEATTDAGAHTVYQITDATKRIWDRTVAIVVKRDGVVAAANLYTLNRLTGRITFLVANGGAVVVTVSGSYLPTAIAAGCDGYQWSSEVAVVDDTDFDSANTNSGFTQSLIGLSKFTAQLMRKWRMEHYFEDTLLAGTEFVIEFYQDRTQNFSLRMWGLLNKSDLNAVLTGNINGTVAVTGVTDADGRIASLFTQ